MQNKLFSKYFFHTDSCNDFQYVEKHNVIHVGTGWRRFNND